MNDSTPPTRPSRQRGPGGRFLPAAPAGDAKAPAASSPADQAAPTGNSAPARPFELYLLRHADAGDPATWTGDDAERPLSRKGRRQSKRLSKLLRDLDLRVDAVITSPKIRAAQTARPVAKATRVDALTDERLAAGFGQQELVDLMAQLGPELRRVVLVGHDPDFSDLASHLLGARMAVPKGTLLRIDLLDHLAGAGTGTLRWLLPPDAVAG